MGLMHIDRLNLNTLRIFQCVYRLRCMTTASKELHLTQSGVSQHIKSLEESLGVALFDRVHRRLLPTAAGDRLFHSAHLAFEELEEAVRKVSTQLPEIEGVVRIGTPIEFGNNRVIPLLSELGKRYPGLRFDLVMDFASQINQLIMEGALDFAFIDDFNMDRTIETSPVAEEVFELVASSFYLAGQGERRDTIEYFETLDYIDYKEGEPVLRSWFHHHFQRRNLRLKMRAHVMDVQGVARFVVNGLGVGVLPDHVVKKIQAAGDDVVLLAGGSSPLKNRICLAKLRDRSLGKPALLVFRELRNSFLKSEVGVTA